MAKELNDLLRWKEKEGEELHACQSPCQKKMLQGVKKQLQDMHEKFNRLKEDFVYNLRILEERDKELEHYDVTVTHLKISENAKLAEISDLRIQLDQVEQMLFKERRKRCELYYHYQKHIEEHKLELEQFCGSRNRHIDHQHEESVNLKHHVERKTQKPEGACQKRVKLLTGELEALKETGMQTAESLQTAEMFDLRLEKENHFNDFVALEDAWHEELAPAAKEKAAVAALVKEAQVKQFKELKQQIRELQMKHKSLETELCRREWHHSACLREKDALIRKYKQQLSLAAEQKWILEQSEMQAEMDWEQLCDNAESNQYQKSQDRTQSLSSAREQIFEHDDKSFLSKDIPTLEIKKLQEQNASLRAAIAQMRKEMESLDEQVLSSLPLTESRQLTDQGSLCTNNISTGNTSSNIKVSSANLDCVVNPDTEKGPNPKVLEEEMVDLGQQLPDMGPGIGLQYGVSCTLQGMQNKLREATRKISILSQEKQQLIEMGNRLRAELGMVLKEGLWHPVSSKRCTVCIASGSLFPRELVKRTQCQLSALKHLQHRLTTQELQYAKPQHPSRISSLLACPSLKEAEAPSSYGEKKELPYTKVQLDFSVENHGPEQRKADRSSKIGQSQPLGQNPGQAQQVQLPSSRACDFCQGEFAVTHSTEQPEESQQNIKAKDKLEMPAADLTVRGTRLEVQKKLKSRNLSPARIIKPKISSNMAKIRNYNIRD
ncbi:PREDICTED: coiled-coil domain-containing protein 57 [Calidris pugnax]|uniref:coiled-coil domain-containing protein 57 n=1 Tax=Calidris pugnax TaxID=198806 RepID=UPI00071C815C|nr:PREDICTED: coiled-coil domain-containing protein 57 [Calidris pugnax]XP_014805159.1 PREDICTED: coiled-coil domain-containing protein 57 [Calidris pugnax]